MRRTVASPVSTALLVLASIGTLSATPTPVLVQLPGTAGCVSDTGLGGVCADGVGLSVVVDVVTSPDGRNLYAISGFGSDALAVFDRDPLTGALTQKAGTAGCISASQALAGICAVGVSITAMSGIAVSPDGAHVYVASQVSDSVAVFDRNPSTGGLTQKIGLSACVAEAPELPTCADGQALDGAFGVAVSPDGRHVYVASRDSNAVAVFSRGSNGALTQLPSISGCIAESLGTCTDGRALVGPARLAVSPDGHTVYVASRGSSAVAVLDRASDGTLSQNLATAGCIAEDGVATFCIDGRALSAVLSVAISPDGRQVYAVPVQPEGTGGVAILDRDPSTGALSQSAGTTGCISEESSIGPCTDGKALAGSSAVAVSTDGESVYVVSQSPSAVAAFDRNPATGTLAQKTGTGGCAACGGSGCNLVAEVTNGDCAAARALHHPFGVNVSPDGRNVYVASTFGGEAVVAFSRDPRPYDVDGDGSVQALTDGLLLLRWDFGFRGATLITGAVNLGGCSRCTAADIEAYLAAFLL